MVGKRETETADALRRAALSAYVPSRVVQMLDPEHDPILLGRSGFAVEAEPVAYLELGGETRATERTPAGLMEAIERLEKGRR